MSDIPAFDLQTQLAHANQANKRLAEDLRIARMTIENHKLREITLQESVIRAENETRKVKQEAVLKAAEIVEAQFNKDLREFCAQIGIEPQGSESLSPSQRVAATMAWVWAQRVAAVAVLPVVNIKGVQFGPNCWLSHEKIMGMPAEEIGNSIIGRAYMNWVWDVGEYQDASKPKPSKPAAQ